MINYYNDILLFKDDLNGSILNKIYMKIDKD